MESLGLKCPLKNPESSLRLVLRGHSSMLTFGQLITERRKSLRLTQVEVAQKLSMDPVILNNIENDRYDPRNDDLLNSLAAVLDHDPQDLSAIAAKHPEHKALRKRQEDDEYKSLAAFRLSKELGK